MKVAYYPFSLKNNKYIEISQGILKNCGCEIVEFKTGKRSYNYKDADLIILNFFENLPAKNSFRLFLQALRRIWVIKEARKYTKVVFAFHDRQPHDRKKGLKLNILRWYLKRLLELSDKIIVLSHESKQYLNEYLSASDVEKKAFYIPHPNYIGAYTEPLQKVEYPSGPKMKMLFVGLVRKYKNIELILECAKRTKDLDIEYTIAGKCTDEYKAELLEKMKGLDNVRHDLRFIDDAEIELLIRENDIAILPYDTVSEMNSGTIMLVFSNGRSVISSRICTIGEFDESKVYTYTYQNSADHLEQLEAKVRLAYDDWKNDHDAFTEKGKVLFETVRDELSGEKVAEYYELLFKELFPE